MSEGVTGGLASTQSPLAVIADTGNLVAEVAVPEKYYDLFTQAGEGLAVEVSSQVGKAVTGASLVSIAPYIDPATKTFRLKVSLDDPSSFTIGSYVKVRITYSREEDVMALPESVMKADGSLYYVEDGVAHYIAPYDAVHSDGWFAAPAGYEDKDFVIEGQNSILDGESVVVKEM